MQEKTKKKKGFGFLNKAGEGVSKSDPILFNLILVLLCFGLIMCFSASAPSAQTYMGDSYYYLRKQLMWAVLGLVAMGITMNIPYKIWKKYTGHIVITSLVLLVITLFMPAVNGARRWIGIGGASFQPSEVAKLAVILLFAKRLEKQKWEKGRYFKDFVPYLFILGVYGVLLLLEPHFSCTVLICMVAFIMLFISGAKIRHFVITMIPLIPAVIVVAVTSPYRLKRITSFLDPFSDPSDSSWQIIQSLYAIGSGGLFGLGLGQSRQKYLYLPEPQNDFIFSIICEELGFFGAVIVIALFALLIWRGIYIAINAKNRYGCLVAVSITALIAVQVILNIAVVTSSMPVTGMPLPFFSAGGSSLLFVMASMGILLNISKSNNE